MNWSFCGTKDLQKLTAERYSGRTKERRYPPRPAYDVNCHSKDYYFCVESQYLKEDLRCASACLLGRLEAVKAHGIQVSLDVGLLPVADLELPRDDRKHKADLVAELQQLRLRVLQAANSEYTKDLRTFTKVSIQYTEKLKLSVNLLKLN